MSDMVECYTKINKIDNETSVFNELNSIALFRFDYTVINFFDK